MGFFNMPKISSSSQTTSPTTSGGYVESTTPPTTTTNMWFDKDSWTLKMFDDATQEWKAISSSTTTTPTEQGGAGMPQLAEAIHTFTLGGYDSQRFSLPLGFDKYDIRIVEATNSMNQVLSVLMFEKSTDARIIYKSLENSNIYDICNIPCEDKDGTGMAHFEVSNKGIVETEVTIRIKATSLF